MPYAYLCEACNHLSSRHYLDEGAPIEGPYRCTHRDCVCTRTQGGVPDTGISKAVFDRDIAAAPDLVRDLLAEVEQLRDDLRVERITTHLCESVDADLRETRAEVERLRERKANVARTGGYIAGVMQRERDEALAEVARLEGDLDGAAYRAGRKQGELAEARAAVDRVRKLVNGTQTDALVSGFAAMVSVDAVIDALDGEA